MGNHVQTRTVICWTSEENYLVLEKPLDCYPVDLSPDGWGYDNKGIWGFWGRPRSNTLYIHGSGNYVYV